MSGHGAESHGGGHEKGSKETWFLKHVGSPVVNYLSQFTRGSISAVMGSTYGMVKNEFKTFGSYCNDGGHRVGAAAMKGMKEIQKRRGIAKFGAAVNMGSEVAFETLGILPAAIIKQTGLTLPRWLSKITDNVQKGIAAIFGNFDDLMGGGKNGGGTPHGAAPAHH